MIYSLALSIDVALDRAPRARGLRSCTFPSLRAILPGRGRFGLPYAEEGIAGFSFLAQIIFAETDIRPSQPFAHEKRVQIDILMKAPPDNASIGVPVKGFASDLPVVDQIRQAVGRSNATSPL